MPKSELVSTAHRYNVTLDDGSQYLVVHEWDVNLCCEDWYVYDSEGNEVEDEELVNVLIGIVNS